MNGAATVHGWAERIRSFADGWPTQGASVAAERITRQAAADTGGDGRLSNYRGGAATVSVEGGRGEATASADGSMGLWAILESGTRAHTVKPKAGRFLLTPRGPRRIVNVQGVAARQTFTKGKLAGVADAVREADAMWGDI